MKTLEYIGPKQDGERHLSEKTGHVWMPGDVHGVSDEHAHELLEHPTSWREVKAKAAADSKLAKAQPAAVEPKGKDDGADVLPAWAKKGIGLGATDEQLQAVAAAGGPETEAGAALWKDATGTDWTAEVKAPVKAAEKAAGNPAVKKAKPAAKKTAKKAK